MILQKRYNARKRKKAKKNHRQTSGLEYNPIQNYNGAKSMGQPLSSNQCENGDKCTRNIYLLPLYHTLFKKSRDTAIN
jgi:hypothetical protein